MITVTAASDIHGSWDDLPGPPEANILAFAGDVTSDGRLQNGVAFINWAKQFVPYFDDVVMIPGNHDNCFSTSAVMLTEEAKNAGIQLLIDTAYVSRGGCRIYGTPWSLPYGRWMFMAPEDQLVRKYAWIPADTQLLISHGPPKGILDLACRNIHAGSNALLERIKELADLKAVVFGHIHEARGRAVVRDGCVAYNVATLDASYVVMPEPWTTFVL